MAQLIREWVISREQCTRESRIDRSLTRPPLQNPNEHITVPEDAMQIDLVPELSPSGGYTNIVTAMDMFSRYLFAYPTSNQDANTIAKVLINIMNKHAQTIGLLERSHMSIKQALKIETGERRSFWHKYVSIAVLHYNTSYHKSIGCEPSRVFHCRIPYNILDLKLGICPQQQPIPTSQIAQDVLDQREMIHQDVRKNAMQAYIKYKAYYDQNLKKQITYIPCSRKRIIKEAKFHSQNFAGWARILLRKCYQTTIIWYANLALTRRKCFTGCECVSSQTANHQPTNGSTPTNTNLIPK